MPDTPTFAPDTDSVQRMLAQAQAAAHVGGWELDLHADPEHPSANPLRWTDETFRIFGHAPHSVAVTNELFFDAVLSDDRHKIVDAVAASLRTGRPYEIEHRIVRPDGAVRVVHEWGEVDVDAGGRPVRILGTCQDVTDLRRTEAALRESEERFRALSNLLPQLTWVNDAQGNASFLNDRWCEYTGKDRGTVLHAPWVDVVHADDVDQLIRTRQEGIAKGEGYEVEYRLRRHDGQFRWHLTRVVPFRDSSGEIRGWFGAGTDVHDMKMAEQAIIRSGARITRLQLLTSSLSQALGYDQIARVIIEQGLGALNAAGGCVCILAPDGRHLRMVAFDGLDACAMGPFAEFPLELDVPIAIACRTRKAVWIDSGAERARRYPDLPQLVNGRPVGASAAIPLLIGDRLIGGLTLAFDHDGPVADDDRQFADALARQCAQAMDRARLYEAEQRAREQAEAASKAKDQFLAVLSHELRTPLTPVVMAVAAMQAEPGLSPQMKSDLTMVRRNIELETRIIDDLLDISRIINGKFSLHPQGIGVHGLLQSVADILSSDVRTKRIRLAWDLSAGHDEARVDAARMQQVFWNILKNAVKFTPGGNAVTIRTANPVAGRLLVEVEDTGEGIEADYLPRIFDAFDQGDRHAARRFGGLGLGLAISKAIVDMHGGEIAARSEGRGRGATFSVMLPTTAPVERLVHRITPPAADGTGDANRALRVLLVDDHVDTLRTLRRLLELSGYVVTTASSVTAALTIAESEPFDMLVSDIGLPDGTGLDLMRTLRDRRPVPAIAITGYGMDHDVQASLDAGFAAHMTKPIDITALEATMKRLSTLASAGA